MDESDNILFSTLKQAGFQLQPRVQSIADINSDDLLLICLHVLQLFKVDTAPIRQLKTKFRFATKIYQQLTKHIGTQFQLNDLMNSTNINNVRRILVSLMSKLSMLENKGQGQYQTAEQRTKNEMTLRNENRWKGWLGKEWVHPGLLEYKDVKFQSHKIRYDMNQEIEKKDVLRDFRSQELRFNIQAILNDMYSQYVYTKKRQSAEEGIKINRQGNAEANLDAIKQNNREDWTAYKTQGKKLNKMKKRMVQASSPPPPTTTPTQQRQATIFQQQVQQLLSIQKVKQQHQQPSENVERSQTSQDPMAKMKFDIERVKKAHEKEINSMLAAVQAKEQEITKIEKTEVAMEEDAVKKEEQMGKMKASVTVIKKEAEKKQILLNSIEVPEELTREVKELTEELGMLKTEAKNEVERLQTEIKSLEQEGSQKLTILSDMKDKLSKIQQDYVRVTKQIAQKNHQKQFITIPQGGISRNYYNKRITQMQVRWKQGRKQIDKAQQDITKTQQHITSGVSTANRIQTQIQNLLNMDKAKNEALNKLIREQYEKYRNCFKETIKAMNAVSEVRGESREYEAQAAELAGKSYKTNVEKLRFALEDVRKERLAARKSN